MTNSSNTRHLTPTEESFMAVAGHRTTALEDSRILPIVEGDLDATFGSADATPE